MDDELRYFKITGDDINGQVIIACKIGHEEVMRDKFDGYKIEECERPENANVVMGEPCINEGALPFMLSNPAAYRELELKPRRAVYDGPNCGRCANRFKRSDWCNKHYYETKNCYRFKLEK